MLKAILGVDLCRIEGISEITAVGLLSEMGTDMCKWKSSKHFAAWLNVVPNTRITGGKIISSRMQKRKNHAGQALRMAASTLGSSKSPLGDYYRKMRSRLGKKGGVIATAHKMAGMIYTMIKEKVPYDREQVSKSQERWKSQRIKYLEKQLKQLKKAA